MPSRARVTTWSRPQPALATPMIGTFSWPRLVQPRRRRRGLPDDRDARATRAQRDHRTIYGFDELRRARLLRAAVPGDDPSLPAEADREGLTERPGVARL